MLRDQELQIFSKYASWKDKSPLDKVVIMEKRIILIRWLGIVLGILTVPMLKLANPTNMYALILFAAFHNVLFQSFIFPHRRHWLLKPAIITIGDILMGSAAIYVTGGLSSDFYVSYFLIAVLSAIRFGGVASATAIAISIFCYVFVIYAVGDLSSWQTLGVIALRMGFVAITGLFAGFVGDKARQIEEDLQIELDQAHFQLNESTALLNKNLDLKNVLQTAVDQARVLLDADLSVLVTEQRSAEFLAQDYSQDYSRAYYSVENATEALPSELLDRMVEIFQDKLRLSSLSGRDGKLEGSSVQVAGCLTENQVVRILNLKKQTPCHIIYTPIAGGENRIARLYIMKLNINFDQIRETKKKLIEVFSNRIYTAITNSLVYTQSKTQAFTDSVTGLYNHRFLQESIKVELEKSARRNVPLSLIMLDIDSFKQFNDTYGHSVGDLALKSVAKMIKEAVNDRGIAARYGGDEFVIVLPGMSNDEAFQIAEEIRSKAIQLKHVAAHDGLSSLSISLGVATSPDLGHKPEQLFNAADAALYVAKLAGRNVVKTATDLSLYKSLEGIPKSVFAEQGLIRLFEWIKGRDDLDLGLAENQESRLVIQTIEAIIAAIDAKDHYTRNHSKSVSSYSIILARKMGLPVEVVEKVRVGSLLHDVGKIGISDAILKKPAKLTPEEYEIAKQHSHIGEKILKPIGPLEKYIPTVLHHHEWYDGSGYPEGLKGPDIPIEAKIVGICDAFDAMTSDRAYRQAMSKEEALAIIKTLRGIQFDPDVAEVFELMIRSDAIEGSES